MTETRYYLVDCIECEKDQVLQLDLVRPLEEIDGELGPEDIDGNDAWKLSEFFSYLKKRIEVEFDHEPSREELLESLRDMNVKKDLAEKFLFDFGEIFWENNKKDLN